MILGMFFIIVGVALCCCAWSMKPKNGGLFLIGILFSLAGIFIGTGSSPSRDAPNGNLGIVVIGYVCGIIGFCIVVGSIRLSNRNKEIANDIQNKKNNGDLTTISPDAQKYARMLRLASPDLFAYAYNLSSGRVLSAHRNEVNSALIAEATGAMFVKNEREHRENYPIDVSKIHDMSSAINMIDIWSSECYPPYQIKEKLIPVLESRLSNSEDVSNMKNAMSDILLKFDEKYSAAIRGRSTSYKKTEEKAQIKRSNITTTGLDYGIITNSVSNMMLYSALDAREHEKQAARQQYSASKSNNAEHRSAATRAYNKVMQAQEKYISQLKQIVELTFTGELKQ